MIHTGWGYTSPDYYEQVVLDAIDYYNSAGGIVVFAAGNDNSESCYYPGCYDGVVGVAALDDPRDYWHVWAVVRVRRGGL